MTKPKVIVFSNEMPNCPCYKKIFADFEILIVDSEKEFSKKARVIPADAAVICFCSCSEKNAEKLSFLDALTSTIPLLVCLKSLDPDFIVHAAQTGIEHFLFCDKNVEEIKEYIHQAIRKGGLKKYLDYRYGGCLEGSIYIHKMIALIVYNFPRYMKESEISEKLNISIRSLQRYCHDAFGIGYSQLMRGIRVSQALLMMEKTSFDNIEIALQLNYKEASHLARDFRKFLGYSPSEARRRLLKKNFLELLT